METMKEFQMIDKKELEFIQLEKRVVIISQQSLEQLHYL
jgi:hypothetical protein